MSKVGLIYNEKLKYPNYPYDPDAIYPEIPYDYTPQPNNNLYSEIRDLFNKMGYDKESFNTKEWNPLGFLIKKGDKVLIKPNLVIENDANPFSVITHPSLLRILIDYVFIATGRTGEIVIADAPQTNAKLKKILSYTKIDKLVSYLNGKGIPLNFTDLRYESMDYHKGIVVNRTKLDGDPSGYKLINLKDNSILFPLEEQNIANFYGADYDRKFVMYNHNIERNCYLISKTALDSDVIISVPKLKTHKKTGVTLNLKNFVGINGRKNYLPHYRVGSPSSNGDTFPYMNSFLNTLRYLKQLFKDLFLSKYSSKFGIFLYRLFNKRNRIENFIVNTLFKRFVTYFYPMMDGNWYGNDTIWRTILDLNIIMHYVNRAGVLKQAKQREFLSLIDGIIGGEKNGPLTPKAKRSSTILLGENLLLTDCLATKIMGFDISKISLMEGAINLHNYPLIEKGVLDNMTIASNNKNYDGKSFKDISLNLEFEPATGWFPLKESNS